MTVVWVVGARGLLGAALSRAVAGSSELTLLQVEPLPWSDRDAFAAAAAAAANSVVASAGPDKRWMVLWAAGNAVTATPPEALTIERGQLNIVLDAITAAAAAQRSESRGVFFYASSAGGIYAGAAGPPYTERSVPVPIAPYGRFKLAAEEDIRSFSARSGIASLNGRLSNLYGPGQRLDKMQGLISHLALAQVTPTPANIYVSLDTVRDYLYIDDAAAFVLDAVRRLYREADSLPGRTATKNFVSGTAVTIADLLGYVRQLAKGHPHVMLGQSASASLQARDLRIRSTFWPELDDREFTPLPVGMHATIEDIRRKIQAGRPLSPR